MRRREFITLLGGAAVAWPLAARGQQSDTRRVGVLMPLAATDPEAEHRVAAIQKGLQENGWIDGRNLRLDFRFTGGNDHRLRAYASELVGSNPDVILAGTTSSLAALLRDSRNLPIVFAQVADPVAGGFVTSLARPGGNITGFAQIDFGVAEKWLELLKELAPGVTEVGVIRDPANPASADWLRAIEAAAPSLGPVRVSSFGVRGRGEIENAIETFATAPKGGLIVLGGPATAVYREQIIALAKSHRLPAIYPFRYYVTSGGLASYGFDNVDLYYRAAGYVGRILKGEKPADLPIQQATKFELVINLKTAKALGLEVPPTLLAHADEVIE